MPVIRPPLRFPLSPVPCRPPAVADLSNPIDGCATFSGAPALKHRLVAAGDRLRRVQTDLARPPSEFPASSYVPSGARSIGKEFLK